MKKIISFLSAVLLAACIFSSCASSNPSGADSGKLKIVTTIFPGYDWVRNVLGENPANAELTMLLDNSVDLHSYQPTAADILKISTCDLFVYVGGESDEWVDGVLKEAANPNMTVINLLEALGDRAKEEESIEGMEPEDHDHEAEYDEHVWLSLKSASVLVQAIAERLSEKDATNASVYQKNASAYIAKLNDLDKSYEAAVSSAPLKTLLFGDRFPFRYMADDYGLSCYAAFAGCSAETEASFETISFLSNKINELSLHAVLTIEGSDRRIAETIVRNTQTKDQKILTLDSLQTVSKADIESGTTYLSVMEKNLSVLKDALQ